MPPYSCSTNHPYCDSKSPEALSGEKDACGVGFLAQINGIPSHWVLQQALRGLKCMEHRGGCGGDGDSGDGAGILCAIPWNYLKEIWPAAQDVNDSYALGMIFLPNDEKQRETTKKIFQAEAEALGFRCKGWRLVPIKPLVLGPLAKETVPFIEQWLIEGNDKGDSLEQLLYRLRKRIEIKYL